MAQRLSIHPTHPQPRLMRTAADRLAAGGIVVYPTDSGYALAGRMGDGEVLSRLRALRGLPEDHLFTLVCRDLSELSTYARVDQPDFRTLKAHTPGPYTFVLPASRGAPKRLMHPKRRTVGLRVPSHPVARALLAAVGHPLVSTSLSAAPDELSDPDDIMARFASRVDVMLDAGACACEPTTVIELDGFGSHVVRSGVALTARAAVRS